MANPTATSQRLTLKDRVRNSVLWPTILKWRAARFEKEYRRRRDAYERILTERGLHYDEPSVIAQIEQRLRDRGYTPKVQPRGQIHTFSVIGEHGWHGTLLRALADLGPHENFNHDPYRLSGRADAGLAERRRAFNDALFTRLEALHRQRPVHWVFVYGGGRVVMPQTLRRIHDELGVPTATMCLDDKNGWSGGRLEGIDLGQRDVAGAYDLVWTSAKVACGWYLAEGGRPIFLPEGCDPVEYAPQGGDYTEPMTFMGACYGSRPFVVGFLRRHGVPLRAYGQGWTRSAGFAPSPTALFSRSQINLGIGSIASSEQLTNVKGRDFDVACTGGGLYLTTFNPDLAEAFDVGREIICYRNLDEAVELAHHYLRRPDDCRQIATLARDRCLREHTWAHRFDRVTSILRMQADR